MFTHRYWLSLIVTCVVLCLSLREIAAAESLSPQTVKIGAQVGDLSFKDIRFLPRSLKDFKQKKAFVLVFTTTSCPLVQRYLPTLNRLEKEYRDRGVQFVAVNVGAQDSIVDMAAQAVAYDVEFPMVKDFEGTSVAALGAQRTPETVILDGEYRIRYRGRIDDQYRLGGSRDSASRSDLSDALEELLAGKEITVAETPVDGCLIHARRETAALPANLNYVEHAAPILHKHCAECHRPGTAAPFSLTTYEEVTAQGESIAEAIGDQRMPPWFASKEHGTWTNHRGLKAAERDTIVQWVQKGMPRGAGTEPLFTYPDPAETENWLIGKPDLVVNALPHEIPAEGLIPYRNVVLPYSFPNDVWVQNVEIRSDNPRVLHHCNMAYFRLGEEAKESNFITGNVPGGEPMNLKDGIGFFLPKGAMLGLQIHFVTTGKPEKCNISVGFRYARETIQKRLRYMLLADYRFAIPPGAPAHPVSAGKALDCDAYGVGLFVHMHLRGRDMTFKARLPDGKEETLLVVPNYNFEWQMPYVWEAGKQRFPQGTRLEAVAHYDNSEFNPYNPAPDATVKDGPQTKDEMMNGFIFYVDANEQLNLQIDPKNGKVIR